MKKILLLTLLAASLLLASCNLLPEPKPNEEENGSTENGGTNESTPENSGNQGNADEEDNENLPQDDSVVSGSFAYRVDSGEAEIVKYLGADDHIVIPDVIDGYRVTKIKSGAFVTEVQARGNNENGNGKDKGNHTIYIPDSIVDIEKDSFDKEGNIYVTNHPNKPGGWKDDSIKGDATNQSSENGNIYFKMYGDDCVVKGGMAYLYDRDERSYFLIACFNRGSKATVLDEIDGIAVNHIGNGAFENCTNLTEVTLSKHTLYIYNRAFRGCKSLKNVNFNSQKVVKILSGAFSGCESLEKIVLPENTFYLSSYAFSNCGNIKELHLGATMSYVHGSAFSGTTVEQIYYGSNEIDFMKIDGYSNILSATNNSIAFSEKIIAEGISSIADVKKMQLGVGVTVRGYVANYCDKEDSFLLIDENNENGILVHIRSTDSVKIFPSFGQYIEIAGSTSFYDSEFGIANIESLEIVGESKDIEPIRLSLDELEENFDNYLYRYLEISGTVVETNTYHTYLDGLTYSLFSRNPSNPVKIGDKITLRCTVGYFGNVREVQYSYKDVTIHNDFISMDLSITEVKSLNVGTHVKVSGYVACYYVNNTFLIVNEDNTDGIVIYVPYTNSTVELPQPGDFVEVVGYLENYYGMHEITTVSKITKIGEGEITPIKISGDEASKEYAYRYIEIELTVSNVSGKNAYFEETDMAYYSATDIVSIGIGDKIVIKGTIVPYYTKYNFRALPDNVTVVTDTAE